MAKTRVAISKAISEAVLKEFNYKCAVCGKERPHIHHIDEDPSNNELLNLIPLCPNCHLIDQHNPTSPIDAEKLRLFREFKDPTILKPQFHPLFARMRYLNSINTHSDASTVAKQSKELVEFIAALEMGSFYSKSVETLLKRDQGGASKISVFKTNEQGANSGQNAEMAAKYIKKLLTLGMKFAF